MVTKIFRPICIPLRRQVTYLTEPDRHLQVCRTLSLVTSASFKHLNTVESPHHFHSSPRTIASRTALVARHLNPSVSRKSLTNQLSNSRTVSDRDMPPTYSVRRVGQPNTLEYRVFVEKDGVPLSWFHDIPLYANEQHTILNMVVEIPRWTNAKLEVGNVFKSP